MEELTKQQIVLVTILTSFVTSIATGIVVVSLTDQAPQGGVVQTINRIVERTVEKVVTPEITQPAAAVKPFIITVEDQLAKATEKATASTVRVKLVQPGGPDSFVGLGVVITKTGVIMVDKSVIDPSAKYVIDLGSSKPVLAVSSIKIPEKGSFAFLSVTIPDDQKKSIVLSPLAIADPQLLRLGQTILSVSGKDSVRVYQGIVENISSRQETATTTDATGKIILSSKTVVYGLSSSLSQTALVGSPLVNLAGEIIGIKMAAPVDPEVPFEAVSGIQNALSAYTAMR